MITIMKHYKDKGFTLIEVTIVLFLGSIVLTALSSSLLTIMKSSYSLNNYSDMVVNAKRARNTFTSDVSKAHAITYSDPANFIIAIRTYLGGPIYNVEYDYDSINKTLTRTQGAATTTLMRGVETMSFSYYTQVGNATTKNIDTKKIHMEGTLERLNGLENNNTYAVSTRCSLRNLSIGN